MSGKLTLFPITLRAYRVADYTDSPYQFREVMRAALLAADPKATYYAFDVVLLSRTRAEFVVYDMEDSYYGGIGKETHRVSADVPAALTENDVERAIHAVAAARREKELAERESAIVAGIASEIRAQYPIPAPPTLAERERK